VLRLSDILLRVERESSYASELFIRGPYDRLTPVDHSLPTELVMGVLRWRSLLDSQISEVSSQPLSASIRNPYRIAARGLPAPLAQSHSSARSY